MKRLEHRKSTTKWNRRYLEMAQAISKWSKHPDWQVGAVAVGNHGQILSTGYNGWPRGVVNEDEGHARGQRPSLTIHAEANVIYNASLSGVSLEGSALYVFPLFPCVECAKAIVQVGISQIYFKEGSLADVEEWVVSLRAAFQLFKECDVALYGVHA